MDTVTTSGNDNKGLAPNDKAGVLSAHLEQHKDIPQETLIPVAAGINALVKVETALERLDAQLEACERAAGSECVFRGAEAYILLAIVEGRKTYDLVCDDDIAHRMLIERLMARKNRERRPSLKKAAYNSICLACNPTSDEDFDRCSEWAYLLKQADLEKVSASDFPTWAVGKSIRKAKEVVRAAEKNFEGRKPKPLRDNEQTAVILQKLLKLEERMQQLEMVKAGSAKAVDMMTSHEPD